MSTTATVPGPRPGTVTPAQDDSGRPAGSTARAPGRDRRRPSGRAVLTGLASLAINFVVPLLAYYLIRPHTGSSAMALALAGAIPVVYTLVILAVRRRLSPVGVVGVGQLRHRRADLLGLGRQHPGPGAAGPGADRPDRDRLPGLGRHRPAAAPGHPAPAGPQQPPLHRDRQPRPAAGPRW